MERVGRICAIIDSVSILPGDHKPDPGEPTEFLLDRAD
jgi:hypothetical protein